MSSAVSSRPAVLGAAAWLALATAVGATGVVATLRPPGPQILILLLTIVAVFVSTRVEAVRRSIDALSTRALIGVHLVRFVGIVFLVLAARGDMSPLFAERAGTGDFATALAAVALVFAGDARSAAHRWTLIAWSAFGIIDLTLAVGTAAFVVLRGDVPGLEALVRMPLVLVLIFAVPLLFVSHIAMLRRLASRR